MNADICINKATMQDRINWPLVGTISGEGKDFIVLEK